VDVYSKHASSALALAVCWHWYLSCSRQPDTGRPQIWASLSHDV